MATRNDAARRLADMVARAARHARARRTLLLDLDGTLAPIAPTPEAARVPETTLAAVETLVDRGWRVAIVSGRPSRDVRRLVPLAGIHVFGSHGVEGSWSDRRQATSPRAHPNLGRLVRGARALAAKHPGSRVEKKPAGVAIHDRGVARGDLARWRADLEAWLDRQDLDGLEVMAGKRVHEIRPVGAHKGSVVRALPVRRGAPRPDPSLVAIGDDVTDEDMFRAMAGRGLTVRVGREHAGTAAVARLASPAAVGRFLARLAEVTPRPGPQRRTARAAS